MITPDLRLTLETVLTLALFGGVLGLLIVWQTRPLNRSRRDHVRRWLHLHVGVALLAVGLAGVALGLGAPAVVHFIQRGGAKVEPHRHIAPPRSMLTAGGIGTTASPDLSVYFPYRLNQLGSSACGAATITELDYINRRLRGELPPTSDGPWSFWRTYWYATQPLGQDVATTADAEAASLAANGVEPLIDWPVQGPPDATDGLHTIAATGTSLQYIVYNYSGVGAAGWQAIVYELQHNRPVGLLTAVYSGFSDAFGVDFTDDTGAFRYWHFIAAVQYDPNYNGHGPAIKVLNSYGRGYGQDGAIWLSQAAVQSRVAAAFVETPGRPVARWLPAPVPTAVLPTAAPVIGATVIGATVTATPVPQAPFYGVYVAARSANLHSRPVVGAAATFGVAPHTLLRAYGAVSGAFVKASTQDRRRRLHIGWITADAVRKETR